MTLTDDEWETLGRTRYRIVAKSDTFDPSEAGESYNPIEVEEVVEGKDLGERLAKIAADVRPYENLFITISVANP